VNVETRELVNDFIIECNEESMHLLNVVSPGWTCAFPIADHVEALLKEKGVLEK